MIYNYLYKGPWLEWQLKLTLWREKNYQLFHELLPQKGKVLDIGSGYGYMAYLLHFASKEREFTGIDNDEEKVEMANNCFSKDDKINFIFADALAFPFANYDAIVMADFLQNMEQAEQRLLIEKCIGHLNPGGSLIIRTDNKDLYVAASNQVKCTVIAQAKNTPGIIFLIKKNA